MQLIETLISIGIESLELSSKKLQNSLNSLNYFLVFDSLYNFTFPETRKRL